MTASNTFTITSDHRKAAPENLHLLLSHVSKNNPAPFSVSPSPSPTDWMDGHTVDIKGLTDTHKEIISVTETHKHGRHCVAGTLGILKRRDVEVLFQHSTL